MLMAARATHMTFAGHDHDARATTEAALELARQTSDVRALALALAGRSIALWGSPCSETRRRLAQELAATGILANNDEWLLDGIELVGVPLLELARVDDFDRVVDDLAVAGRRTGRASSIAQATQWAAMRALMRGDVDTARTLARHVIDVAENAPNFAMGWAAQQYVADRAVGRHDALLPAVAEFAARHPAVIAWRAAYARALVEAGRADDAQTLLTDIVDHLPGSPRTWTWVAALVVSAEAAARLGDTSAAAAIEPLLVPYASRLAVIASGTSCEGAVDRYLGLLAATRGDVDRAAARFTAALALEVRADAPALAMRTRLDFAALLRRRGSRATADAARRHDAAAAEFGAASGLEATAALPW
jgi:hypothetical protein